MAAPDIRVHTPASVSVTNEHTFDEPTHSNPSFGVGGTFDLLDSDTADTLYVNLAASVSTTVSFLTLDAADIGPGLSLLATTFPPAPTRELVWSFDSDNIAGLTDALEHLSAGESVTFIYNITVNDGGTGPSHTDSDQVRIRFDGVNDIPEWSVQAGDSTGGIVTEDNFATGTLTARDIDINDFLDIAVEEVYVGSVLTANPGWLTFTDSSDLAADPGAANNVAWTFDPGTFFDHLASGEAVLVEYHLLATDRSGDFDHIVTVFTISGQNDAPTYSLVGLDTDSPAAITEDDVTPDATGTLTLRDIDTNDGVDVSVTNYWLSGATGGLTLGSADILGLLSVPTMPLDADVGDISNVAYTFDASAFPGAFDYLGYGEHLAIDYQLESSDGHAATHAIVHIRIDGANDAPSITLEATQTNHASITEDSPTTPTGFLTVVDEDFTDQVLASVTAVVASSDTAGLTLSNGDLLSMLAVAGTGATPSAPFDADVGSINNLAWTFDASSFTGGFDYLASGETLTLTYSVKVRDDPPPAAESDSHDVVIHIMGENDPIVLSFLGGDSSFDSYTQDTANGTGTLTVRDIDYSDVAILAVTTWSGSGETGGFTGSTASVLGMFTLADLTLDANPSDSSNVQWTFDAGSAFDYLDDGELASLYFYIRATDGHSASDSTWITLDIRGHNDEPVISLIGSDTASGSVTEDVGFDSGTLTVRDIDFNDSVTTTFTCPSVTGDVTSLSLTAADFAAAFSLGASTLMADYSDTSNLSWELDISAFTGALQHLGDGEAVNVTFHVTVNDGDLTDTEDVVVTIHGVNDLPSITLATGDLAVTSLSDFNTGLHATGSLSVYDIDSRDLLAASVTDVAATGDVSGLALTVPQLISLLDLGSDLSTWHIPGLSTGNLDWTFDNTSFTDAFNYLGNGESVNLTYTIKVDDGHSGTDTATVLITIIGTNSPPDLLAATHAVTDTAVYDTFIDVSDTLTATDPDFDPLTFTVSGSAAYSGDWVSVAGAYGALYLDTLTGAYRYDPDEAVVNALGPSDAPTDVFTVTVSDGVEVDTEDLTFNIDGANDTPVGGVTVAPDTLYLTQHDLVASHTITDAEGYTSVTYSFIRDDAVVVQTGASDTYTLSYSNGDAGHTFKVRVTYTDGGGTVETVDSAFTQLVGAWRIGTSGNDSLAGSIGNDSLEGLAGNDTLNGLAGDDTMIGSTGNDTYHVDSIGDVISETPTTDTRDHIISSIDYTLSGAAANIEYLTLIGATAVNGVGNGSNNQIVGNGINNSLVGAAGNDTIDGGAGDDTMDGGEGNDTFLVDSTNDVIVDSGGTLDQVVATATFSIASAAGVERLTLKGLGDLNATGNAGNNVITGNSGANSLWGGAGNDTMYGLDGNDTLVGESGNDSMVGLTGNDTYYVTETADRVVEAAGQGTDTIFTTVTYTMPAYVEVMVLQAGAGNGTGNAQANSITGNATANALAGLGANDSLYGGGGADTLTGGAGADYLQGDAGADTYVYATISESPNLVGQRDTIVLVLGDGDRINLSAIDANITLAGNQAFTWVASPDALNAAGQLWYDSIAGILYGSDDKDVIAEFAILVGSGLSASSLQSAITP